MASHLVGDIPFPCFLVSNHSFQQANIFGTEQDRVNCSFYYKVRLSFLSLDAMHSHSYTNYS
jgi:hypothetical protein